MLKTLHQELPILIHTCSDVAAACASADAAASWIPWPTLYSVLLPPLQAQRQFGLSCWYHAFATLEAPVRKYLNLIFLHHYPMC